MSEIKPKRTYEVLRPIGFLGTRFERGAKIELTDEQASAFSPDEVRPAAAEITAAGPDAAPVTTGDNVEAEVAVKPKRTRKAKK